MELILATAAGAGRVQTDGPTGWVLDVVASASWVSLLVLLEVVVPSWTSP